MAVEGLSEHYYTAVEEMENKRNALGRKKVRVDPPEGFRFQTASGMKRVVLVLTGDLKFLYTILGMGSASGSYSCIYCEKHVKHDHSPPEDKDMRTVASQSMWLAKRTEDDAKRLKENKRVKLKDKDHKNVKNPSLFPVLDNVDDSPRLLDFVAPSPLHLSLGLGLKFVNFVADCCLQVDLILNGEGAQQYKVATEELEKVMRALKVKKKEQEELGSSDPSNLKVETVDNMKVLSKEVLSLESTERKLILEIASIETPCVSAHNHYLGTTLNVQRQVYHSGALVGNDIAKIFADKTAVVNYLSCLRPHKDLMGEAFELIEEMCIAFAKARRQYTATTYFHDQQIAEYCNVVEVVARCHAKLAHLAQQKPPDGVAAFRPNPKFLTMTPKLHIFIHHTPQFLKKFKTIGVMSEQGGEVVHKYVNKWMRRFSNRSESNQQRLALQAAARNTTSGQFERKKRKHKDLNPQSDED